MDQRQSEERLKRMERARLDAENLKKADEARAKANQHSYDTWKQKKTESKNKKKDKRHQMRQEVSSKFEKIKNFCTNMYYALPGILDCNYRKNCFSSFILFYRLLCNHRFKFNPNLITNLCLNFFNYICSLSYAFFIHFLRHTKQIYNC